MANQYRAEKIHHKVHRHLKHHVHRLRQKPEHHRKAAAFGVAFSVTLVVFMLWYFLSLPKILEAYRVDKSQNERVGDTDALNKLKNAFNKDAATSGDDAITTGASVDSSVDSHNPYAYPTDSDAIQTTQ